MYTVNDVIGRVGEVVSTVCIEVLDACSVRMCDEPLAIELRGRGFIERNGTRLWCRM